MKLSLSAEFVAICHLTLGITALILGATSTPAHLFFFINSCIFGLAAIVFVAGFMFFAIYQIGVAALDVDTTNANYIAPKKESPITVAFLRVVRIILILTLAANAWYWSASLLLAAIIFSHVGAFLSRHTDMKLVVAKAQEMDEKNKAKKACKA